MNNLEKARLHQEIPVPQRPAAGKMADAVYVRAGSRILCAGR